MRKRINKGQARSYSTDRAGKPGQGQSDDFSGEDLMHENKEISGYSRRDFLKLFGYGIGSAAVLVACKRAVQYSLPYIIQPPEITPGMALYYASAYFDGHEYASIVVKNRDGRPIKIEGNALSAFNGEGTTARVQASVLSLYDDARLKEPFALGKQSSWETIDPEIIGTLGRINSQGGMIVLLTSDIISPATTTLIGEFGSGFRNFKWVRYNAISHSAIPEANLLCFGKQVVPDYHFDKANLVVSVNADFLGTWIAPVHFIPAYVKRRKLNNGEKNMLRHVHYESGLSTTGSMADIREKIKPSEEKAFFLSLHNLIAERKGELKLEGPSFREDLTDLADELIAAGGSSIILSGTNNKLIQIVVNRINFILGNYQNCIDLDNFLNLGSAIDSEMEDLITSLNNGAIGGLIMYNVNPVFDYPGSQRFISGLKNTQLSVNMAVAINETVGKTMYECPVSHFLESWDDSEIVPGMLSITQPCINPIFNTRSFQDSLLKWMGKPMNWYDYLNSGWKETYFPISKIEQYSTFREQLLQNGVLRYSPMQQKQIVFNEEALPGFGPEAITSEKKDFEIILYESIPMGNGIHANNPWLMELPDPLSKQCWENVAAISAKDAQSLGIVQGDIIKIIDGFELPAYIQPGQAEGTISVALGYGHSGAGPVADHKGINAFPYIRITDGNRVYGFSVPKPEKTGRNATLALTQVHSSMEGRPIIRSTTFSRYKTDKGAGNEFHKEFVNTHQTLYPDIKFEAFHWGMAIDLNACVSCLACVIACQAENNVPTVGKSEVTRRRVMHWIKIDRYYSGDAGNPKVLFQPITCQHCSNAPCENVCPVAATNHSSEGLNQMSYNRCVGTKYCINNCPYRVRRFNWFRYTNNKAAFDFNSASDLGKMVLNPDVTVRERGVVEKCSFCVQRIQAKKLQAKLENRVLKDFEIKTACMQACPAGAIIFGDLNDPESRVSKLTADPRCYQLLEDLHTLPSNGFLTRVWNDEKVT